MARSGKGSSALPRQSAGCVPFNAASATQRAERLLEAIDAACWEASPQDGRVWCSPALLRWLTGERAGAADWAWLLGCIDAQDRAAFEAACAAALALCGRFSQELRLQDAGGGHRWVHAVGSARAGDGERPALLSGAMLDIHEQKLAETELRAVNERFARVVQLATMSYYERSTGESAFHCHDGLSQVMGRRPVTGTDNIQSLLDRNHPDDWDRVNALRAQCWSVPGSWGTEARIRHGDGSFRWNRLRGRSERLPDGRMRVTVVESYVHDEKLAHIELESHRHHLEQLVEERTARLEAALAEAKQQREEAERATEAKSLFLAHMSHEIRTPLNGVLGLNELALRDAQGDRQRRLLTLARDSGRSLLAVINDVLDFSRLTADVAAPKCEPFDLGQLLADTLRCMTPLLNDKGITLRYDYLGGATRVLGDRQRLHQIATNLIGNGLKFTEQGELGVVVQVRPAEPDRVTAQIAFCDTGPGMTPEIAARIFEPFVQGDDRLARRHGGTGLGLAIARRLAESMDGVLTLQTEPGLGSTFMLRLPLALQAGEQPAERCPLPGTAWLVCREVSHGFWLQRRLHRLGWATRITAGLAALERDALPAWSPPQGPAMPPDLVILDPAVLTDAAAVERLPALLPNSRIVLLMRADWSAPAIETAALDAGLPLITQPLSPTELIDLLAGREAGAGMAARTDGAAHADLALPGQLDVLVAEDNPVNQLIISEMIQTLGLRARLADDGAHAVRACLANPPGLVLMDLQMPGMDGLAATRQLRHLQRSGELPPFAIVGLTAHATPQDRERAVQAGMVGYLTKPLGLDELRYELMRWCPAP